MKKLLIVVDYQNDCVKGSLGFKKAVNIEENIADKINEYRMNGDDIAFTFDSHGANYLETQEGLNLPVTHCVEDTEGWQLYGKIAKLQCENDKVFKKITFGSSELMEYLKDKEYMSIELIGVVTNICIISNAVIAKAALPEVTIIVDADCVASNDDDLNEAALKVMESMQIKIMNK